MGPRGYLSRVVSRDEAFEVASAQENLLRAYKA
jgi:hypothetical protein